MLPGSQEIARRLVSRAARRCLPCLLLLVCGLLAGPLTPAAVAAADPLPQHPAQLAPLTRESTFPRFTPEELAAAGYPDHKHVFGYPGFVPFTDADGQTYGPSTLVRGRLILRRDGLSVTDTDARYRCLRLRLAPDAHAWQALPLLEMLDWAQRELSDLLEHALPDTLVIQDTRDLDDYRDQTGYAFHRLYQDRGDVVIVEPARILVARGLAAHAAFHLVAARILADLSGGVELPAWLIQGLAHYLAEDGPHFHGQLAMYRGHQPVVLEPVQIEAILRGPPDADDEIDRWQFRAAGYSAFLMAWELVEHRGGLAPVRALLNRIGDGEDPDTVSRELFGQDLVSLAADLDPTRRPEPVGGDIAPKVPQQPPAP
jgi:hypothetical protein